MSLKQMQMSLNNAPKQFSCVVIYLAISTCNSVDIEMIGSRPLGTWTVRLSLKKYRPSKQL